MIHPTRRCVAVLAAGLPLALLPALVSETLWPLWAGALAVVLAIVATDLVLAAAPETLVVEARAPELLHVGAHGALSLVVTSRARRRTELEAVCDLDEILVPQPAVRLSVVATRGEAQVPLVPLRRGKARLRAVWLRWTGPFGLVQRTETRPLGRTLGVVPNTRAVRDAAVRFFGNRELQAGLKVERYMGDGSEFESLREHAPGFDARSIDWKASARHRKLLGREFRAERNHQVVLALDTGYLMSEPLAGIPKLDHAIGASLLLAYVALRTGDRVGLFAFDERVRLAAEPHGGVQAFPRLQQQTAGLAYTRAETNFTLCLLELEKKLRRRSLVIVLTDFVDTVTAELMIENLTRLGRRHLVLFVSLRDPAIERLAEAEPRGLDALNRAMTAKDLLRERDVVLSRLKRRGVRCIDAPPAAVGTRLVNRYLDAKRRELV